MILDFNKIFAVYKKGLLETLRDKKTLLLAILVPLLLYPVLMFGMAEIMAIGTERMEEEVSKIGVDSSINQQLQEKIKSEKNLELVKTDALEEQLKSGKLQAYLKAQTEEGIEEIKIYYDGAIERSRQAEGRLYGLLQDYKRLRQEEGLTEAGVDIKLLDIVEIKGENIASADRMGGFILGEIIPLLLIITIILGAMYPAIDLTAGEKERGTLETILSIPIKKIELLFGKYLTVTTIAAVTGVLNLISMGLMYLLLTFQLEEATEQMVISLSPQIILTLFLLLIPLVLFISAVTLSVCIFANSFKEAQNYLSPMMIIFMLPALISMMPGIELNSVLVMIPVLNIILLLQEVFVETVNLDYIFLTFITNSLYSILAIYLFAKLFQSERILFSESKGYSFDLDRAKIKAKDSLNFSQAGLLFAGVLFLLIYLGSLLQFELGLIGVFLTQWLIILLPALIMLWYFKADFKSSLKLNKIDVKSLLGSLLIWAGLFIIIIFLTEWQARFLPETEALGEEIANLMRQRGLLFGILAIVISPAICEELLFRGVLLSAAEDEISYPGIIILVGLLFGVFHLSIFRLVPTFILGVFLTYLVYHVGSVLIGVIIHFLHNLVLFLITFYSWEEIFASLLTGNLVLISVFVLISIIIGERLLNITRG